MKTGLRHSIVNTVVFLLVMATQDFIAVREVSIQVLSCQYHQVFLFLQVLDHRSSGLGCRLPCHLLSRDLIRRLYQVCPLALDRKILNLQYHQVSHPWIQRPLLQCFHLLFHLLNLQEVPVLSCHILLVFPTNRAHAHFVRTQHHPKWLNMERTVMLLKP